MPLGSDPDKFPEKFPQSYESLALGLKGGGVKFRVMAWSEEMAARFAGLVFDERWERLSARSESAAGFLGSLDLIVSELDRRFAESRGPQPAPRYSPQIPKTSCASSPCVQRPGTKRSRSFGIT